LLLLFFFFGSLALSIAVLPSSSSRGSFSFLPLRISFRLGSSRSCEESSSSFFLVSIASFCLVSPKLRDLFACIMCYSALPRKVYQ
jgi:hypothetical protein